jgi:hypothetical protein
MLMNPGAADKPGLARPVVDGAIADQQIDCRWLGTGHRQQGEQRKDQLADLGG